MKQALYPIDLQKNVSLLKVSWVKSYFSQAFGLLVTPSG
jgi:hypothetical protein